MNYRAAEIEALISEFVVGLVVGPSEIASGLRRDDRAGACAF
jgi:hypothetical protein